MWHGRDMPREPCTMMARAKRRTSSTNNQSKANFEAKKSTKKFTGSIQFTVRSPLLCMPACRRSPARFCRPACSLPKACQNAYTPSGISRPWVVPKRRYCQDPNIQNVLLCPAAGKEDEKEKRETSCKAQEASSVAELLVQSPLANLLKTSGVPVPLRPATCSGGHQSRSGETPCY